MAVTGAQLKAYLRTPPDDTEDMSLWISAAVSKARSAGIPVFAHNAQYDLFILSLAASLYENRGLSVSGTYQSDAVDNTQKLINSYVLELRHATEDPIQGGSGT